ncbi:hypothetical protein CC86DRAFT_43320 [Ophiobolus disseminans]|uniref:DUF7029 domain-containing protein n=1 Tax=Ophiobolus disseminans TaxID=1469910 RepID=A0A6A6ZX81_9PLEO|nr:hypothetical protein CC86DRAFT_43320 [Ophiobolus disseminans]
MMEVLLSLEAGGLLITSHYGCNTHGERSLSRVGNVRVDESRSVFVLGATQASWETAFQSVHVKTYHTEESHAHRSHCELRKRQNSSPVVSTKTDNAVTNSMSVPTATSTSEVNTLNLTAELINKSLKGSENSSFQLVCKNCSTFGSLDLLSLDST